MGAGVTDFIDLGDDAIRIDDERDALRVEGIRLVGAAFDSVCATNAVIRVGQQSEPELLVRRERVVIGRRIERRADDRGADFGELRTSVTEALAFASSTAGRGLWVPPQDDP